MKLAEQPEAYRRGTQRVGSLIKGKYKLEKLLGAGGMASVYEATHRNGIRVAVKILHPEMSQDPDMCQRFLREGYVANKVGHKGAVRVLDDDVCEDGSVFLVMELLEGDTLDSRWEDSGRRLPADQVLTIGHQLLDILASAHAQQIVHRDIKPDNIFLTRPDDTVNVLDFGIARLREGLEASATATRTGRTMGTPAFMPNEQALGRAKEIDHQTDIWAVGATLFTLLTGRHVHMAESVNELLVFAATKHAPKVATLAPEVPRALADVVDKALEFDKSRRWPDARSMQAALGEARASVGSHVVVVPSRALGAGTLPQGSGPHFSGATAVSQDALAATVSSVPSLDAAARISHATGDPARDPTMASIDLHVASVPSTTHVGVASSQQPDPSPPLARSPKIAIAFAGALLLSGIAYAAFFRPASHAPSAAAAGTASIAVDPPAVAPRASTVSPSSGTVPSATPAVQSAPAVLPPPASATAVAPRPRPPANPPRRPPASHPAADPYGAQ